MSTNNNRQGEGMQGAAAAAFGIGRSQRAVIEEEQPTMRSVAIGSRPTQMVSGGGPQFGKAPPMGIGGPFSFKGDLKLKRSVSAAIAVKQEWNEANWKVCDLEKVPVDFPLERTHREIQDTDATEVAERISKTLRLLSVDAEYDGEKAKAKCTTSDMVSFRIRLFAGGEDGGLPVVVEVQRRNGSPSSFMRICRQILNGAEGSEIKAETVPSRKKMPPFMMKGGPIGGMKCLQGAVMKEDPEADMTHGLTKSMDLLRSKQKDVNILGLENLCLLTDPLKTRSDVALKACKAILFDKSCTEIREEVAVMLQKDAFLPEEFENDDDAMKPLIEKSRHLVLILLSNTLVLTSKDNGCLAAAIKSTQWFGEFLIPSLLDEVKAFETSSNNAYEAACGLTSLAGCSDVARRVMEENSAVEDLQSAYRYGTHNHELLANESERALIAMGKSI